MAIKLFISKIIQSVNFITMYFLILIIATTKITIHANLFPINAIHPAFPPPLTVEKLHEIIAINPYFRLAADYNYLILLFNHYDL